MGHISSVPSRQKHTKRLRISFTPAKFDQFLRSPKSQNYPESTVSNSERFLLVIAILPHSARSSVSSIIFVLIVLDAFPVFHVFNWAFGSLDHRFTSFEWILSDKNNICRSAPTSTQFNSHFWWSKCYILYETRIGSYILRTFWGINRVSLTNSSRDMSNRHFWSNFYQ